MNLQAVFLKWVQLAGLAALVGPAVVWLVGRRTLAANAQGPQTVSVCPRLRGLAAVGALLLLGAAAAELILHVQELGGLPVAWEYVVGTHIGRSLALRAAVAVVTLAVLRLDGGRWLRWLLPLGLVGASAFGLVSHQDSLGWPALACDFLHTSATAVWAGGLLGLSVLPWRGESRGVLPGTGRDRPWGQMSVPVIAAFSRVATVAVSVVAATGAYVGMANIASVQGLTGSIYGQTLLRKLALFSLLLAAAALDYFWLVPHTRRSGPSGPPADALWLVSFLVRLEALLVLGVILLAALLSSLPPPVGA